MNPPSLRPRTWRVVAYFVGIFAAVAGPTVGVWMLILLGPPAYRLDSSAMTGDWRRPASRDGVSIQVREYSSDKEARKAASAAGDAIVTATASRGPGTFRYRQSQTQVRGTIVCAGNVVVQAEGPDRAAVENALDGLPFLKIERWSSDRWLSNLFENHLVWVFVGIGVYTILVTIGMFKGGAWAARIAPAAGVAPIPGEEMRRRLLAVNGLDVPVRVRQNKRGHLVAEWRLADAKWTGILEKGGLSISHSVKFKLDDARHAVRAIDFSRRVSWSAGVPRAAFSFSFFRGIVFYEFESAASYGLFFRDGAWQFDHAYRYSYNLDELKQPLVEAVVMGGWTYQPVAFFFPLLG